MLGCTALKLRQDVSVAAIFGHALHPQTWHARAPLSFALGQCIRCRGLQACYSEVSI